MKLDIYQIDAFATKAFEGNPAAICPLQSWLPDTTMQAIAAENNLSETAFVVPNGSSFDLRWFTPTTEVALCGHATLAAAYVYYELLGYTQDEIAFNTQSGVLTVAKRGTLLQMNFPAQPPTPLAIPPQIEQAFALRPLACLKFTDIIAVFESEAAVRAAQPDQALLKTLDCRGIIITSIATDYDFVARFFAPKAGIAEDPVTGSAFTQLVPYWAKQLGKSSFRAKQVSQRGGEVLCELQGDRVLISGRAVKFMQGTIEIQGDSSYAKC